MSAEADNSDDMVVEGDDPVSLGGNRSRRHASIISMDNDNDNDDNDNGNDTQRKRQRRGDATTESLSVSVSVSVSESNDVLPNNNLNAEQLQNGTSSAAVEVEPEPEPEQSMPRVSPNNNTDDTTDLTEPPPSRTSSTRKKAPVATPKKVATCPFSLTSAKNANTNDNNKKNSTSPMLSHQIATTSSSPSPAISHSSMPHAAHHHVHVNGHSMNHTLNWNRVRLPVMICFVLSAVYIAGIFASPSPNSKINSDNLLRLHGHLLPPKHARSSDSVPIKSNRTLRDYLTDDAGFHLGLAPAFFGFYGYFGALAAWQEGIDDVNILLPDKILSVAGASAGAMAAVLLAAGIPPRVAANFCSSITLEKFADFPGLLAAFRGDKFERIMHDFMQSQQPNQTHLLQDALIPVAVTAFDLQTMSGHTLSAGSMAKAARASATFPLLFQPVGWKHHPDDEQDFVFIDGGIADMAGLVGLNALFPDNKAKRIVNMAVGDYIGMPTGPSGIPGSTEVLSISIQNLPNCGPWAMANGPKAVDAASKAMMASLDLPLYHGAEANHFEVHIDASSFWQDSD